MPWEYTEKFGVLLEKFSSNLKRVKNKRASKQTEEEKIGIQSIEITKESLKWDIEVCSFYSQSHGNNSLGPFSRRESQSVLCSFPLFAFVLSSNIQAFFAFDSYSICIEVRHFFSK